MTGTIINTAAVIAGGAAGHFTGRFFGPGQQEALTRVCGVSVLFIAVAGAMEGMLKVENNILTSGRSMLIVVCIVLGTIIGEFIGIISGSLIIEKIFAIPGVGSLYISSINLRDYNFFMALTFFYTFIGLFSGIVMDISYGFIDPRIRMGAKK